MRSIHSALYIHNTKQIFLEQKTKRSFVLHRLCPVHEVLTGIWNPLISGQIVNLFGPGKCAFDCQSKNLKNYASGNHVSTSSCMLRIEKLITFNISCMWTFLTNSLLHACMWTFLTNSLLHEYLFPCVYTNNYKHFHK